jgi:hypothetical protein
LNTLIIGDNSTAKRTPFLATLDLLTCTCR